MIQIVASDERDYINEYKHFDDDEMVEAVKYIQSIISFTKHREIKITRFNRKK